MTKRLYYDCPIKALYMMKEFGIKLVYINGNGNEIPDYQITEEMYVSNITGDADVWTRKHYVAPESEAIFEPKKGDRIMIFPEDDELVKDAIIGNVRKKKIIMRDNKQFFSPLKE